MRRNILCGAAGLALMAGQAWAEAPPVEELGELVVVGSRGAPRLATETSSPVDVFTGEELAARGFNDLSKVMQFVSPSFNFPRSATGPSAANTRSASLRGLSPDQVLVLVNGRRRHSSSVLNFNNNVGRGTVPIDFNTIPASAIARVEVLRDGAAAQYGSDAIAGVINIVLRDDAEGGLGTFQIGATEDGDGETAIGTARQGFKLGEDGFLTLAAEARYRNFTNSARVDPRVGRVTQRHGDPESLDLNLAANAEVPLPGATLYGFATFDRRYSESAPLFRLPNVAPALYPLGFLPLVEFDMIDFGGAVGVRGEAAGWSWDLSDTVGFNRGDFAVSNSANTSLGAASPRRFESGGTRYGQNLVNLTVNRRFEDVLAGANLAAGLEHRFESFKIVPGEPASYQGAGAQGFPGYNPPSPVNVDRTAYSAFIDGEISPVKGLDLGLAARFENYSDFGDRTTGKASLFWRTNDWLAVRATASTGFRAPALQQQHFATVTSQLSAGQLVNVGTFAVSDPVARALGASDLKPEKSRNISAGVVLTPIPRLSFTADVFRIEIDDRIALSESLSGPAVTAILAARGITNASQVRFFTNAADTRTEGWEAAVNWSTPIATDGRLTLTLAYAAYDNDVKSLAVNPVLPALALLGPTSIGVLTDAQPRNKVTLNAGLDMGRWSLLADVVRFGKYRSSPLGPTQVFGDEITLDLTASVEINKTLSLHAGVINATDEYPDEVVGSNDGRPYTEAGGLGVDGREYFVRVSARF
ncbi:TonB-dependent siderophore receptor [Phenylobacterium sp. Root700]|uniref:TonB-dependent receptor plug domain-containing protein n=1 Tax=Phenylobacterium sp. Root700 TaxID=1736591 RepID=UPI0006F5BFB3|nr:TonB-dependent receptor [Phenylobacterium sp. Root700]KRB44344.1 outer membrane receptor protein [Phenylobacterium sp. Root700]